MTVQLASSPPAAFLKTMQDSSELSVARQAAIESSGLTPLEYMLTTMRDESKPEAVRPNVAKAVAPYIHPRLASVEQAVEVDVQRTSITVTFVNPDSTRVKSLPA